MIKLKELFNKYKLKIVIALLFIFAFTIGFTVIRIDSCSTKKVLTKVDNAIVADFRASIVDSVRTAELWKKNAEIDSMKAQEAKKTIAEHNSAVYWEQIANKRGISATKQKNRADSLAQYAGEDCKPFLDEYRQANDSLKSENVALDSTNLKLNIEAESYSRRLYLCEQQNVIKDTINASKVRLIATKDNTIAVQKKSLNKKESIFKKAEKWFFGVAGAVGAILILK